MARSHPPALLKIVERTLRDECTLAAGERILLALSGGGDSSAMAHVLSVLSPKLGFSVVAHGVDHGLRPEAGGELDIAAALCERLRIPFTRTALRVAPGGNLQARARDARRSALVDAADRAGAARIATAHHADDRAETIVMRLLNGASAGGLAALPPAEGRFVRPLIRARKTDVVAHLERHDVPYASDPSNTDRRFLRVRLRLEVMPLLQTLSPSVVLHLTSLADELAHGSLPATLDETGEALPLRGAHVRELRRALRLGKAARIRLPGDRDLVVDPAERTVRVDSVASAGTEPRRLRGSRGTT